jgi:alpha-amylase
MWPEDIAAILGKLKDLPTDQGFAPGSKMFVTQEVIDRNDGAVKVGEYYDTGYVTEFRYCQKIAQGIQNYGELGNVVDYGWGMAKSERAFIFVDNHDNQRGHGGAGEVITHKTPREYKQGVAFTLALDYGFTRIMSSYSFDSSDQGPPHNGDYTTADVPINDDGSCGGGWVCEHRWNAITKMVRFRNAVVGKPKENFWTNGGAVAFSRGNAGFFAMAKEGKMDETLPTGLPAGTYCNLIDNCKTSLTVGADGKANVKIDNYEDPILAVCVGCDATSPTAGPTGPTVPTVPTIPTTQGPTPPPLTGVHRTVIFIKKQTMDGQDMFIRGGIDEVQKPGCTEDVTSDCAIPIKINSLGTTEHYAKYNAWSQGDTALDWYGPESGQGSYLGKAAEGTPLAWTSKTPTSPGYQSLNKWGDHYWMVDFDMDCSLTEQGWFEVKAFVTNGLGWEGDITQGGCQGSGRAPYASKNHVAKCGFVNMFDFGTSVCEITPLSDSPTTDSPSQCYRR